MLFLKNISDKKQPVKTLGSASRGTGCPGLGSHRVETWGSGVRFTLAYVNHRDLPPAAA